MDLPRNAPKACLLDHVCHGKVIYHDHGGPEQLQVELLEQQGAATLIWWTGIYFYKAGGVQWWLVMKATSIMGLQLSQ